MEPTPEDLLNDYLEKAGPYIGPRGGKYADPDHKISWKERESESRQYKEQKAKEGNRVTGKWMRDSDLNSFTIMGPKQLEEHFNQMQKEGASSKELYEFSLFNKLLSRHQYRFFNKYGGGPKAAKPFKDLEATWEKRVNQFKDKLRSESVNKSFAKFPKSMSIPGHQRELMSHENAIAASKLRKGEESITVGVGVPYREESVDPKTPNVQVWHQGSASQVLYTNQSDQLAAELVKSNDFYPDGAPQLGAHPLLVNQRRPCPTCKNVMIKSLTVCPHCGVDVYSGPQPAQELQKSLSGPLRPSNLDKSLYLPNGVSFDDEE